MKKVTIKVEKSQAENFYSCYMVDEMPDFSLSGFGKSALEAMEDLYEAEKEIRELLQSEGKEMPELEYRFKFDIGSFFNYFDYLNIAGIAKRIGVNASLMRRYAVGLSQPREERKRQIEDCLHQIGKELQTAIVG